MYNYPSLLFMQVRGVKPLPLMEVANLLNSFRLNVCPGLVSLFFTFSILLGNLSVLYQLLTSHSLF